MTDDHSVTIQKLIVNRELHTEAQMTKSEFLERIRCVKHLRATGFQLPLFITDEHVFNRIREFYEMFNLREFRLSKSSRPPFTFQIGNTEFTLAKPNHKYFAVEVDEAVFKWFANTDLGVVQRQIVSWMAAVYTFNHGFIKELDELIYAPVLDEIRFILKAHYPADIVPYDSFMGLDKEDANEDFSGEDPTLTEEDKLAMRREEPDWKLYQQACLAYAGSEPVEFLGDPFSHDSFGIFLEGGLHSPAIDGRAGYMKFDDWTDIVVRDVKQIKTLYKEAYGKEHHLTDDQIQANVAQGETDTLARSEGSRDLFDKWRHEYTANRTDGVGLYSLYDSSPGSGLVYVLQQEQEAKYKIGWTEHQDDEVPEKAVYRSLSQCKTGNPENISSVGFFRASSKKAVAALHRHFESKRINREWFALSSEDVNRILDSQWRRDMGIY